MQEDIIGAREKLQQCATELVSLMLHMCEAAQKAPLEAGQDAPPTARHKAMATLIVAVRENINAFAIVEQDLK